MEDCGHDLAGVFVARPLSRISQVTGGQGLLIMHMKMNTILRAHKTVFAVLLAVSAASAGAFSTAPGAAPGNADMARVTANQIEVDTAVMKHQLAVALVEGHAAAREQVQMVQVRPDGRVSTIKVQDLKESDASEKLAELSASDLELAERVWQIDQVHAMVTLRKLIAKVERSGLADDERTVSKAYWLLANAIYANQLSCDMAYQAMYKSLALGFVDHWPAQFSAYKNNLSALHNCVPAEKREALMARAQAELDKSPLRNRVNPELAAAAGMTANAESLSITAVNEAPAENPLNETLKKVVPTGIGIAIFLASLIVVGKILGGSSGPSSGSSGTSTPSHPTAPSHKKRQVATSKRRVGMQRMSPWN